MERDPLAPTRLAFAEQIRALAPLRSDALVRALSSVARERFVGPGPWKILRPDRLGNGYQCTPDDDPRHLYDNVLVALDAERNLNNGEPAALARWIERLELRAGDALLHVGCGVGYYTAIAAELVRPDGRVVAVEIDPVLAERARRSLAADAGVTVVSGDGSGLREARFDAIFVNAGATEPAASWLDALHPGGRLLVPLTVELPGRDLGAGHMLLVVRRPAGWSARFVSTVGIFHCAGARTPAGAALLGQAYRRGATEAVRSLRREPHRAGPDCWLHAPDFCLSRAAPSEPG
jgi:protein-L-isoaspartate(D-aspartate) O-methyltransferase